MDTTKSHILGLYILVACSTFRACHAESELESKADRIDSHQLMNSESAHDNASSARKKAEAAQETADKALRRADDAKEEFRRYVKLDEKIKLVDCETNYWGERVCKIKDYP